MRGWSNLGYWKRFDIIKILCLAIIWGWVSKCWSRRWPVVICWQCIKYARFRAIPGNTRCSQKKIHSFGDFAGNSRAQKSGKTYTKRENITGVQYLFVYQQVVSTSYFILYPLLILISHYLHQLTSLSPPSPPPAQMVIRNRNAVSPPELLWGTWRC